MMRLRQHNEQDEDHGPEMLAYVLIYCLVLLSYPTGYALAVMASWLP